MNCYSTNIFILFNIYRCIKLTNQKCYQKFSVYFYQSVMIFRGIKDYYTIHFVTKGGVFCAAVTLDWGSNRSKSVIQHK
jgi:hypothetical protein